MAPVPRKTRQRNPRQNSNVFATIDKQQLEELNQAFQLMDVNEDGVVDAEDLETIFEHLGQPATPDQIEKMMSEAPSGSSHINFMVFLTMMADKLTGTDPEQVIIKAFAAFDDDGKGEINADYLRECMTTMGDRFTDEEVDIMFKGAAIDEQGNFDYKDFVRVLKHGE
ncbi:regulatory myosin light chain short version [Zychaea mexicana]|uniref:regulatory myosin light chain short version n=1 Tax=Zychaea mexicana TaxID=64656 RepID=UPI0022FEA126|nr:regulatory myosin light chain short version [Zychaea mexicana]KAI9497074.1 regulatory myosin light chain short version [Zychaea mexicana]